jgi:hypothetical protein
LSIECTTEKFPYGLLKCVKPVTSVHFSGIQIVKFLRVFLSGLQSKICVCLYEFNIRKIFRRSLNFCFHLRCKEPVVLKMTECMWHMFNASCLSEYKMRTFFLVCLKNMSYALPRITVNAFCIGTFIKIEDCKGGSSYTQCCICGGLCG